MSGVIDRIEPSPPPTRTPGTGKVAQKARHYAQKKAAIARHNKKHEPALPGISKNEIRRLARRGGVKRMSGGVTETAREALHGFLAPIIKDSIAYMECAQRKTVMAIDVIHALKRNGRPYYGLGAVPK